MTSSTNSESVLAVDDDPKDLEAMVGFLNEAGFKVEKLSSGLDAVELLGTRSFDLVVTDIVMRPASGFEVIKAALKANPESICIAMTSFGSVESAIDALHFGAYSYLQKPCDAAAFRHCIHRGLEKQRLTKELRRRNIELEELNRELDTKVQEATEDLRELNHHVLTEMASLQEVDKLKNSFLDNVSHDLKSPLTTIRASIDMLRDEIFGKLSKEGKVCLALLRKGTDHMHRLINQLLEATQLTSGNLRLDLKPVEVHDLIDEAVALIGPQAQGNGVLLESRWESESGLEIPADRGRLLQILGNLLGNATKFTPKGGSVTLRAWPEKTCVHFCVEDTGPGISAEHLPRLFERFYQVDRAKNVFRGLGLGLRIARDLVENHNGRIWVESELGKGSQFHFQIPREVAEQG